jgi:hypothetical protein
VSEARLRFFHALGYREGHVDGAAIVVGDMLAQYKSRPSMARPCACRCSPWTSTATALTWCSA